MRSFLVSQLLFFFFPFWAFSDRCLSCLLGNNQPVISLRFFFVYHFSVFSFFFVSRKRVSNRERKRQFRFWLNSSWRDVRGLRYGWQSRTEPEKMGRVGGGAEAGAGSRQRSLDLRRTPDTDCLESLSRDRIKSPTELDSC